jgi:hypothetical protein
MTELKAVKEEKAATVVLTCPICGSKVEIVGERVRITLSEKVPGKLPGLHVADVPLIGNRFRCACGSLLEVV